MHPVTSLMLVQSIERERYEGARTPRPAKRQEPIQPRPTFWGEMSRVYQLGFATRP